MAATFPNITPSSRNLTMGDLPSKVYRAMSGATVRRAFGNKKTGYVMKLQFKNLGDDVSVFSGTQRTVKEILDHYCEANGTFDNFNLGSGLTKGMGTETANYFKGNASQSPEVRWRYAKPPEVQSVKAGLSNVSVELIGEINA
jgi:hypothetical protein